MISLCTIKRAEVPEGTARYSIVRFSVQGSVVVRSSTAGRRIVMAAPGRPARVVARPAAERAGIWFSGSDLSLSQSLS